MATFVASEGMGIDPKTSRMWPKGLCHGVQEGDNTTFCVLPIAGAVTQLAPWPDHDWATLSTNAVVTRCERCDAARL